MCCGACESELDWKAELRSPLLVVTNSIAEKKKMLNSKWKLKEAGDKYKFANDQLLAV